MLAQVFGSLLLSKVWLLLYTSELLRQGRIKIQVKLTFVEKKPRGKNWKSVSNGVVVTNGRVVIVVLGPTLVPVRFEEVQEGISTVQGTP